MTINKFVEKMFRKFEYHHMLDWMPDKVYLKTKYLACMHKRLNLKTPETFNEKLQWLKLYDRKPEYTQMVDKYEAKKYAADKCGGVRIIPTLGVWDYFDAIDFDNLPNQFVLKCTHDSGGLVICRDKSNLDKNMAKKRIERCLNRDFYLGGREWPYKNVKPRIIAEKYMEDDSGSDLKDYKFFCFNGKVRFFKVDFDRYTDHHANYYDLEGKLLPFGESSYLPIPDKELNIPQSLQQMIEFAEKLSTGIPFLRVDFYDVGGNVFFGELTFFPASGFGKFSPDEADLEIGKMLELATAE